MRWGLVVIGFALTLFASAPVAADCGEERAESVMLRGVAMARESRWADAKTAFERAIALDPNVSDAHFELAEVSLRLGDEKSALVHYTKAIELAPDKTALYASLADLYMRLGFDEQAERTLVAGETRGPDDAKKFTLYTLHGDILDGRGDKTGALTQYEHAKKSCGACIEGGQSIAFFNLGMAYATVAPPRKAEAMANLQAFQKMICKGAAAQRYVDQCMQMQVIASKLGGTLQ